MIDAKVDFYAGQIEMITTIKAATNLPELIFICEEYGVLPIFVNNSSVYLALQISVELYKEYPDSKFAVLDSNTLLEIVSYELESELLPYIKQKGFTSCYIANKNGSGVPINE